MHLRIRVGGWAEACRDSSQVCILLHHAACCTISCCTRCCCIADQSLYRHPPTPSQQQCQRTLPTSCARSRVQPSSLRFIVFTFMAVCCCYQVLLCYQLRPCAASACKYKRRREGFSRAGRWRQRRLAATGARRHFQPSSAKCMSPQRTPWVTCGPHSPAAAALTAGGVGAERWRAPPSRQSVPVLRCRCCVC